MPVVPAAGDPPAAAAIEAAAKALAAGQLVCLPTDTVYGLAADPFHTGAVDRVVAAKRRPRDLELPMLVADVDQALQLAAAVPDAATTLMERFWPGPLTIVVPRRPDLDADLGRTTPPSACAAPDTWCRGRSAGRSARSRRRAP